MRKLLISDPSGLMGLLTLIVGVPTTGLAAIGSTVGFRKWWGLLLTLPAFLLGAFACWMLVRAFIHQFSTNEPLVDFGGLAIAAGIAGFLAWRWWPKWGRHGA